MMGSATNGPALDSSLALTSLCGDLEVEEGGGSDGETPVELVKPFIGTDDGLLAGSWLVLEYLGAKCVPQKCLYFTIASELDGHKRMRSASRKGKTGKTSSEARTSYHNSSVLEALIRPKSYNHELT